MQQLLNVSVLGGLGKMGRGIALIVLIEQVWESLFENKDFTLNIIDVNLDEAREIKAYFRQQLKLSAERGILKLRDLLKDRKDLISNEEMIDYFVDYAMNGVEISTDYQAVKSSHLIFEAAFEDTEFKVKLFEELKRIAPREAKFFTNTSSIPIHVINDRANLEKRIIGFHFYNPPVIQNLMEIIPLDGGDPQLTALAIDLAKRFKKTAIFSQDKAGFIGNGHFLREIGLAFELVKSLAVKEGETKAIYIVDQITQKWLLRPMGIFQLLDYVGLDVASKIAKVMNLHGIHRLNLPLLDQWVKSGLKGGQNPDGTQRPGIFNYEKGKPMQIYHANTKVWLPLPDISFLGERQEDLSWKNLQKNHDKKALIQTYFKDMLTRESIGAKISMYWLEKSAGFMQELVNTHVANEMSDVSSVIKLGFFHHYSPDEIYKEVLNEIVS